MTDNSMEDIPPEKRVTILERKLNRAQVALKEAETALEGRMRELDKANRDLQRREADLAERLNIEGTKLLAAQRVGGFATVYADRGQPYQSSIQLNRILGVANDIPITPDIMIRCLHPLDRARMLRNSEAFFTELSPDTDHVFEHRILRPDGEVRWLRWSLRKEGSGDGEFRSISGSVRDITESRMNQRAVRALQLRAERRVRELDLLTTSLAKSRQQAETALSARTEFLSYMAHQFRTPLNTFSGMMDMLSIEERSEEDTRQLAFAARAADRLGSLVNEVIEEAGGTASQTILFPAPLDLEEFCRETQEYWNRASADSEDGGVLELVVEGELPESVLADPSRLREALDNLIGYGLSAAGDVKLNLTWRDRLEISVSAGRLSADLAAKGAEAFVETEPQLRRANSVFLAMDGHMDILESPSPTLHVSVPLNMHDVRDAIAANSIQNRHGDQPSILVAEDTESNRYVIVGLCERLGCRVETAVNGLEAVEAALSQQFDAILMDVQMPVMTGEEAVRHIRASDATNARTPIIGVTAHSLQAERDRLLASGMSACLAKPIQLPELRAALTTAMAAQPGDEDTANLFDLRRFREAFEALPVQFREKFLAAVGEDLRNYGTAMDAAVKAEDAAAADRQAHALKGIAGNIGAIGLLTAISAFRESHPSSREQAYAALRQKIAATLEACGDLYDAMIREQ